MPLYSLGILIVMKILIPNPNFPALSTPRGEANLFGHFQHFKNHTIVVVPNTTEVQQFLGSVNRLWTTMHNGPGLIPINWVLFPREEDLIASYWREPENIPVAVIFNGEQPITGALE